MRQRTTIIIFLLLISATTSTSLPQLARSEKLNDTAVPAADIVLLNGQIITVDAKDSIAQAVAILGGKIVAVGSNDVVKSHVGASTRVIDLQGRTATP